MMKNKLPRFASLILTVFLMVQNSFAQPLSGTYTLPGVINGNTVNNLTQLSTLLNSGTVNGTAIFEFTSSYTATGETYPIIFTAFGGTGNAIIRPAASVSSPLITAASPASLSLVVLSGAQNLAFDGRPGGTGSALDWQFQNTASSGSYPVFLFINGAQHDALKYINVQGSGTNTTGNINFSTSTTGGNSFDTIEYCNVTSYTAGYAYIQIYSSGSAAPNANSNNCILNNNISNFRAFNGSGAPTQGGIIITSTGNGSNWNISGNSIYCTGSPYVYSAPTGGISFAAGANSTGNIISGNYIGGQAPLCGGSMMKIQSYQANGYPDFDGIYNNSGSVTISNNTIRNIYMGSIYGSSTFCGINISGTGTATVSNNLIGSATDTNNIVSGINGTMLGIYNHSTAAVNIDNNIVANLTSNYRAYVSGTSSQTPGAITGIYDYGGSSGNIGATTITNNQVFNLTCASNYNNNLYFYINSSGSNGATFPSSTYNNPQSNVVCGIFMEQDNTNSNTQLISKNTIYGLCSTVTGGTNISYISGIVANGNTGGTNIINGNLIYGSYAPNNYGSSGTYFIGLNGIYLPTSKAGKYYVQDNIIDLGLRSTDGSTVQNALIYGIWDDNYNMNTTNLKEYFYHNSVYIGGSDNSSVCSFAFARNLFYGSTVYDSLTIMNNIFVNNRTTTGTGHAYGLYLNDTLDVKDDYNDIYGTGSHFYFGASRGIDYNTKAAFQISNPGHEAHSIAADPQYVSPTTATPNLHITNLPSTSPIEQAGIAAYTIVYDYDSLIRANYTPVDLGATVDCSSSSPVSVTLAVSQDTICPNTSVTFTATPTNGGTPVYNFYLNGISVQNGASNVYTTSTLANNDSMKVKIIGNSPCASVDTAFSNTIKIVVNSAGVAPTASLGASQTSICAGTPVTFTASATNGGSAPTYKFYKNGVVVQNTSSNTYTNSALNNNDSLWVVVHSNAACASPDSAKSTVIRMTVTAAVTPTVSVSPSQNNICHGTSITFTASYTNGGTNPTFNFFLNGSSVQNGAGTTYSSTSLNNNDSVWVVITSNATCATTTTVTSAKLHMIINAPVTPTISISASQNTICQGTSVTFTATATNGGTTPSYNFYVNGNSVQSGSGNTYTTTGLNNNDSVWVVLTSNAACASPTTVTSTKVHMIITTGVTPTVNLSPSQNNICPGTPVTFTAAQTNGGSTPTYHFYVNGVSVQNTTSNTYSSSSLTNGNTIRVVMTSNASCRTIDSAISNTVTMVVNSSVTPTIGISAGANNICTGTSVTFTTTATGGGSAPNYNFYVNGASVQNGSSSSYTSSGLQNNDSVWVVLTSNAACASPTIATSTKVHMVITSPVTPTVTLSPSQNNICPGTSVTFTAAQTNGGSAPTYHFYVNGVSVQNTTSNTYSSSSLTNGNTVRVVLTSNASCRAIDSAVSNTVTMVVSSSVTPTITISTASNNICAGTPVTFTTTVTGGGSAPTYNFYKNGISVQNGSGSSYTTTALLNNDSVWVVLTSNSACASPITATSIRIHMVVTSTVTPTVTISPSQNNICNGTQVTFTAASTNGGTTPTYNFYLNGTSVQSGPGNTYSSTALHNNDSVWVVVTSNAICASPATAQSTKVHMLVSTPVAATAIISPSQNNVCQGSNITFTASSTNGGTAPQYNFYVNGVSVQNSTTAIYSSTGLHNNDSVWVAITSNAACVSPATATSPKVIVIIRASVTPIVAISASDTTICTGETVNFTTTAINGGTTANYQFFVNGTSVQNGTSSTWSGNTLTNGAVVKVILTSSLSCATPASVRDSVRMIVHPTGASSQSASFCPGGSYQFFGRTLTQAGTYYDTLSTVNGCDSIITLQLSSNNAISTQIIDSVCAGHAYNFNGQFLSTAGVYHDTLHTVGGCDSIVTLNLSIASQPSATIYQVGRDSLATTPFASYQWLRNNVTINGANSELYIAMQSGQYTVIVTNGAGCADTSAVFNYVAAGLDDLRGDVLIQLYPNPTSGELNISLGSYRSSSLHVKVCDLQGRVISSPDVFPTGNNLYTLNMGNCAAGLYYLQLQAGDWSTIRKVEVLK